MFYDNSQKLKPYAEALLLQVTRLMKFAPNFIIISSYLKKTDTSQSRQKVYTTNYYKNQF